MIKSLHQHKELGVLVGAYICVCECICLFVHAGVCENIHLTFQACACIEVWFVHALIRITVIFMLFNYCYFICSAILLLITFI